MAQGKTKVKAKVPKMIAKKQKQKGKGKAFTQRSSKFFFSLILENLFHHRPQSTKYLGIPNSI